MKKKYIKIRRLNRIIKLSLVVSIMSIVSGLGIHIARAAWEGPPANPPGGEIAAPLNVANTNQTKEGWLRIGAVGEPGQALDVQGDAYVSLNAQIVKNLIVGENATVTGNIKTWANIIPLNSNLFLGTEDNPWQSLWLTSQSGVGKVFFGANNYLMYASDSYKFIGDSADKLSISKTGTLTFPGGINAVSGKFTVNEGDGSVKITSGYLGVRGYNSYAQTESYGIGKYGVYGETDTSSLAGVMGSGTAAYGVYGKSTSSYGVYGTSSSSYGVYGIAETPSMSGKSSGVYGKGADKIGGMLLARQYYSLGVYGEGGKVDGFSGELYSYGVYGKGGKITSPGANQTQKTYGVYGLAGDISSLNNGTFITYGVFGKSATSVSGPGAVSYAGYFEGDVVIDGTLTGGVSGLDIQGDVVMSAGQLEVTGNYDHKIKSHDLEVLFDGDAVSQNNKLGISGGDLVIDRDEKLRFSGRAENIQDVHMTYTETTENCLRIKFGDVVVEQFGDPDDRDGCKPLCETGWCVFNDPLKEDCNGDGRHESNDYFCSGTQKICCMPGIEYPPYE